MKCYLAYYLRNYNGDVYPVCDHDTTQCAPGLIKILEKAVTPGIPIAGRNE
jgi:hypothetical protein